MGDTPEVILQKAYTFFQGGVVPFITAPRYEDVKVLWASEQAWTGLRSLKEALSTDEYLIAAMYITMVDVISLVPLLITDSDIDPRTAATIINAMSTLPQVIMKYKDGAVDVGTLEAIMDLEN